MECWPLGSTRFDFLRYSLKKLVFAKYNHSTAKAYCAPITLLGFFLASFCRLASERLPFSVPHPTCWAAPSECHSQGQQSRGPDPQQDACQLLPRAAGDKLRVQIMPAEYAYDPAVNFGQIKQRCQLRSDKAALSHEPISTSNACPLHHLPLPPYRRPTPRVIDAVFLLRGIHVIYLLPFSRYNFRGHQDPREQPRAAPCQ